MTRLMNDQTALTEAGTKAGTFVMSLSDATDKVLKSQKFDVITMENL